MKAERVAYAVISTIIAAAFSAVLMFYDVASAGPAGSVVGLAHANYVVYNALESNEWFYYIATIIGCVAAGIALAFVVCGIIKQIKNKTIEKHVGALCVLYIAVAALFAAFDKMNLNSGPTIMPSNLFATASFPAPWMMLSVVLCSSMIMTAGRVLNNGKLIVLFRTILVIMTIAMITSCTLSGEYWITDIVAGLLVSNAVLGWFALAITKPKINKTVHYNIEEIERKLFANQKTTLSTKLGPKGPQS